ncbi:MAG: MBL fold metallo-hydrolase [Promethearchaeota archaeon]
MEEFVKPISDGHENFYFIEGELRARYPYSNSMLIGDCLIDTGISPKRLKRLKKQFMIKNVFLTHWHEDHISGNRLLKEAKFYCHSNDKMPIENVEQMIPLYNVENTPVEDELKSLIELLRMQNIRVDTLIKDGEIYNIDDELKLQVLFTPGHTAGHCAFYELSCKTAFLGDIDLTRFPYYGNIDANLVEFEESIDKIQKLDLNSVATGHRGLIKGKNKIHEEIENYKSILKKRDEKILAFLSEGSKPTVLNDFKKSNIIYRKYSTFKDFEVIAEILMIGKHLEKFLERGIVSEMNQGYILN